MCKYEPASSNLLGLTHGFYGQAVAGINAALNKQNGRSGNAAGSSHLSDGHEVSPGDDVVLAIILLCVHEAVNYTHIVKTRGQILLCEQSLLRYSATLLP
ncbi:hypothetical protein CGCF413_v013927 [Colletotrichum fructicola]|nr:hypothetical protein CGCF413_v013927 [Colletotrichum fructicola]